MGKAQKETRKKTRESLIVEKNKACLSALRAKKIGHGLLDSSKLLAKRMLAYCIQEKISRSALGQLMEETGLCTADAISCFLRLQQGSYYSYNPSIQAIANFVLAFEAVSGDGSIVSEYELQLLKDLNLWRPIRQDESFTRIATTRFDLE